MTLDQGPFVQIAAFCENALEERDGTKSYIRVIDRLTRRWEGRGDPPEEMEPFESELVFALALKSGRAKGSHRISVSLEAPNGVLNELLVTDADFRGEEHGVAFLLRMQMEIDMSGLYWMKVSVDGTEVTRTPLRVSFRATSLGISGPSQLPPSTPPPPASDD